MTIDLKPALLSVLIIAALATSCKDQDLGPDYIPSLDAHYLYLDSRAINFNASEDLEKEVVVKAITTPWQFIDYDQSWLTISPNAGNGDARVMITATENTLPAIRTTVAQFMSTDPILSVSYPFTITQDAAKAFLEVETSTLDFMAAAGERSLSVSANVDWEAESNSDWLTVKPSTDKSSLVVTVRENTTGATRTTKIVISSTDDKNTISKTIFVTQSATTSVETDTKVLETEYAGGSYSLSITSDVSWSATTSESWIQVTPSEGEAGATPLIIDILPNASTNKRTGFVSVLIGGTEQFRIAITQNGILVAAEPASLTFTASSKQQKLQVKSNATWTVLEKPDWLQVSPESATGDAELTLTATDNPSATSRSGILKIGQRDYGISTQVSVLQDGKYFNVNPTAFAEVTSRGGTHLLHIATDDQWTATSTSAWMQLSQSSGTGDIDVTMAIPDNPSLKERKDTTTFSPLYAKPVQIITQQAGRYLNVDVTALYFFNKGGTSDVVTISTDATYTITSTVSWLTIHQTGNTFTVVVSEDNGESNREGKIVITMTGLQDGESYIVEIPVVQRTTYINVVTFSDDKAWDIHENGAITITVTGFTDDKEWDILESGAITITVTGFKDDKAWD